MLQAYQVQCTKCINKQKLKVCGVWRQTGGEKKEIILGKGTEAKSGKNHTVEKHR